MSRRTASVVWTATIQKWAGSDPALARIVEVCHASDKSYVFEISAETDALNVRVWRKHEISALGNAVLMDIILGRVGAKVEKPPTENTGTIGDNY